MATGVGGESHSRAFLSKTRFLSNKQMKKELVEAALDAYKEYFERKGFKVKHIAPFYFPVLRSLEELGKVRIPLQIKAYLLELTSARKA
jgi:hypothetical protein